MKRLVTVLLFVQIFTNAFALSSVVTVALGISAFLLFRGVLKRYYLISFGEFPSLFFFFCILLFGYLFIATGEKKTNHLLMWMIPVLCYYFMLKRVLYKLYSLDEIKKELLGVITIATLIASGFSIFEFVSANLLGSDLSFIPRCSVEEYTPHVSGLFVRTRSFMEESGHFSLYWEIFAPLSVYWINQNENNKSVRMVSFAVLFLGLLASFSSVGYVCVVLWMISSIVYQAKGSKKLYSLCFILFFSVLCIVTIIMVIPELYDLFYFIISEKLDSDNGSHLDRESRFEALNYFKNIYVLIGYGPNASGTLGIDSFVSFYLGALMSTGILGLSFFLLFILRQFVYVKELEDRKLRFAFFLSLWFSSMHLMFVDIIYVPWLWVMLSLLNVVFFKEKDIRIQNEKIRAAAL